MRSWKFLGSYNLHTGLQQQQTAANTCQITDAYIVASDAEVSRQLKANLPATAKAYDISNGMLKMINNGKPQHNPSGDPWYETADEAMAKKPAVVTNYDQIPKINGYGGGAMGTVAFPSNTTANGHQHNAPQIHRHPPIAPPPIPPAAVDTFDRLKKYESDLRKRRQSDEKRIQEQNFLRYLM